MAETERAKFKFVVKEFGDGTPWIAFEPMGESLPFLGKNILGFDLKQGTTHNKADEIAQILNENIESVSYLNFEVS